MIEAEIAILKKDNKDLEMAIENDSEKDNCLGKDKERDKRKNKENGRDKENVKEKDKGNAKENGSKDKKEKKDRKVIRKEQIDLLITFQEPYIPDSLCL